MRTAAVVGAGVGGLAAAGALSRAGWHVTLIEREGRLHGNGSGSLLWPNGVAAIEALGLSLGDVAYPAQASGVRRADGRLLVDAARQAGTAEPVVVHGDDLHDALMAGLGERLEIRTGTEVTSVRTGGLRPEVGTGKHTFEVDLVVAADGSGSVIRRRLAPHSTLASAGFTGWRAMIPWFRVPKLAESLPPAGELIGAGHTFRYAVLGERGNAGASARGGVYWAATAAGAQRPEPPGIQLGLLRRWFADWHAPVSELLAATEPTDLVQQPGEELRPMPRSFGHPVGTGGIVLLGDAAHVYAPTLAQGACLALEDAATLRTLMRSAAPGATLHEALAEYTALRRARVARVARASRRLGLLLQARGNLAVRARDAALGRLPAAMMERAAGDPYGWTPPT